jgi:hypothetical protein
MRSCLLAAALLPLACGENKTHPSHQAYVPPAALKLVCQPNLDGRIDATEVVKVADIVNVQDTTASFLISPTGVSRQIDIKGAVNHDGQLDWDWSVDYADDQVERLGVQLINGKWYENYFPRGQFVLAMDAIHAEGVYSQDDEGLWLHGYASADEKPPEGKTLAIYAEPVAMLRFPLQAGSSWVAAGDVQRDTGMLFGLPFASHDSYTFNVDATGRLELPDVDFTQVHRLRTHLQIVPTTGPIVDRRTVSFLFECFGTVAVALAPQGETNDDFTVAAEVRRLGLGQ